MLRMPGKRRRCREAGDQLSPYLDGEIKEREGRRLKRHLAQCSSCRRLLDPVDEFRQQPEEETGVKPDWATETFTDSSLEVAEREHTPQSVG